MDWTMDNKTYNRQHDIKFPYFLPTPTNKYITEKSFRVGTPEDVLGKKTFLEK